MDSNNIRNENPYSQNVNVEPAPQPTPVPQQNPYMQQTPEMQQVPYTQQAPEMQQVPYTQQAPEMQQAPYTQPAPEMQQAPYTQQAPEMQQPPYTQQAQNAPYQQYVPVQPVYQQVPVQQVPVQQPPEPKENSKLEKLLCFLSLGLYIGGPTVSSIILYLTGALTSAASGSSDIASGVGDVFTSILSMIGSGSYIGAWVLMIIARVKFKKSVFAKVLMWVYIGMLVLSVVAVVVIVVSCINALKDCPG